MNFLGHCLLTQFNPEFISGNLAGDHFKGDLSLFNETPSQIIKGVKIHRFIDSYTDSSVYIQKVAKLFQEGGVKRISYIASDIILDHYIAKNWSTLSPIPLSYFIQTIHERTKKDAKYFSDNFNYKFEKMVEKEWLSRYVEEDGIELTLFKFEQRIPFSNNLHQSFQVYKKNQDEIDDLYRLFMIDIMSKVNQQFKLNISQID